MTSTSIHPAKAPTSLTDTQLLVLSQASQRDDLRIILPERLKGIIAEKVLSTLAMRGLSEPFAFEVSGFGEAMPGLTKCRISAAGLVALGVEPDNATAVLLKDSDSAKSGHGDPRLLLDAVVIEGSAVGSATVHCAPSRPRLGSKLGHLIRMLKQPQGCTMDDLTQATGWRTPPVQP